jgi:hypothetical protein
MGVVYARPVIWDGEGVNWWVGWEGPMQIDMLVPIWAYTLNFEFSICLHVPLREAGENLQSRVFNYSKLFTQWFNLISSLHQKVQKTFMNCQFLQ